MEIKKANVVAFMKYWRYKKLKVNDEKNSVIKNAEKIGLLEVIGKKN